VLPNFSSPPWREYTLFINGTMNSADIESKTTTKNKIKYPSRSGFGVIQIEYMAMHIVLDISLCCMK